MNKKRFLSLNISIGSYADFIAGITDLALRRQSSYVCVANVHMLVEAHSDPSFADVVNGADIVTPDGMPLARGLKKVYGINQDRVAGMDLLPDLLAEAQSKHIPVFFYGGTNEMLDKTTAYIRQHYPRLHISGTYSPPFRGLTQEEYNEIASDINSRHPGIVFVVLGCPKQERWMALMKNKINACMLGIGGALPVLVGLQKRAPVWMQKNHMEWLFRLMQEPRRLFKRYFITNSIFIGLVLKKYPLHIFNSAKDA